MIGRTPEQHSLQTTFFISGEPLSFAALEGERDDERYDYDDRDPYAPLMDADQSMTDSELEEWAEQIEENTFAGIYTDDKTKKEYLKIMTGRGGQLMLKGDLNAHKRGVKKLSADRLANTEAKVLRQTEEITLVLSSSVEHLPAEERLLKIEDMIQAITERYSGKSNRNARNKEMRRLGLKSTERSIGSVALQRSAAD